MYLYVACGKYIANEGSGDKVLQRSFVAILLC